MLPIPPPNTYTPIFQGKSIIEIKKQSNKKKMKQNQQLSFFFSTPINKKR